MAIVFPTGFVSWRCRRSHTPVNKRRITSMPWLVPANIFYGRVSHLYFGLEEKANGCKHILFIDASQHFEGKTKTYCAKRTLIKSLALSKIVPKKINTATFFKRSGNQRLQPEYSSLCRYVWRGRSHWFKTITTELREWIGCSCWYDRCLKVLYRTRNRNPF
jgi:hypothetical protein